jgi:hypothetical protein
MTHGPAFRMSESKVMFAVKDMKDYDFEALSAAFAKVGFPKITVLEKAAG